MSWEPPGPPKAGPLTDAFKASTGASKRLQALPAAESQQNVRPAGAAPRDGVRGQVAGREGGVVGHAGGVVRAGVQVGEAAHASPNLPPPPQEDILFGQSPPQGAAAPPASLAWRHASRAPLYRAGAHADGCSSSADFVRHKGLAENIICSKGDASPPALPQTPTRCHPFTPAGIASATRA
jgi:hypothetical protein